ncbi:sodium-independent anion transporter [Oceanobacillus zhaokaii]|uniref:Sodium-independent anion transporter n=1 Tax=Oceanobacillus zhaokaii TaxID=2052660 RepID=A0A345PE43_9BACI|nr:SulP family inorganic anion transporter [Oceanobacillus zhaokaii]AXI08273.1 sodium-independent anion transporter [Oceanobacillus zhaokaii]
MMNKLLLGLKRPIHDQLSDLMGDITAGMTVAVLLIPQSMAYALIAGVPVELGLSAASFPVLVYTFIGRSRYLSVGPVSIVSLLAFSGVSTIAQGDSTRFIALMITLTLIVGVIQTLLGFIKVGSFFNYVSSAVIDGFISAAAIIIVLNQGKALFGIDLPNYDNMISFGKELANHISEVNPYILAFASGSIVFLLIMKKVLPSAPGAFIVIIASVVITSNFALHTKKGVDIIGKIPRGFPEFGVVIPSYDIVLQLFPVAFMIAFISFVESYSIARQLANNDREKLCPNQELYALGLANVTSSIAGSIPVAGAISRTAVNYQSGAKTKLSLIVSALFIFLAILFLTPIFYYLPKASLAAIIIIAVSKLIHLKQFIRYLKGKHTEAFMFLTTFLSTLFIDIFLGLMIGITLSLISTIMKKGGSGIEN